mmetsp:Transcript_30167/g.48674  ORF Transcript_30167/g.48674 Transcript_30167/m.48674 type:complete len:222 (-) Transcript_30167:93-758(-)
MRSLQHYQIQRVSQIPYLVLSISLWTSLTADAAESEMDPALMEQINSMKKDKKKNEPAMDPTGEHPLRKFGPKPLVCSACKTAAKQFQGKVARKIKGKWKEDKKRKTFESSLPDACAESAYPENMIVFERGSGLTLGDMEDTMRGGGRTLSIKRAGEKVKTEFLEACRHLLFVEFKDALLDKLMSKRSGKDIDFAGWLCGPEQAKVCDGGEDSDEETDEDL